MAEGASGPAQTAFVVLVPEAEPRVGSTRERSNPLGCPFQPPRRLRLGVPAACPIDAVCRLVALLGTVAGRWRTLHLLPLQAAGTIRAPRRRWSIVACRHP